MSEDFQQALSRCLNYFKDGYSHFVRNLAPTVRLLAPYVLLVIITSVVSFIPSLFAGAQSINPVNDAGALALNIILGILSFVFNLLMIPVGLYFFFCQTRFVVNTFSKDMTNTTTKELWSFDNAFWGFLGLMIVIFLVSIPVSIAGCIGLLFLLVPGVLVFTLMVIYSANCYFAYLQNPAAGLGDALGKGWELIQSNWTRWLALSAIIGGISFVLCVVFYAAYFMHIFISTMLAIIGMILFSAMQVLLLFITIYIWYVIFQCYRDTVSDSLSTI